MSMRQTRNPKLVQIGQIREYKASYFLYIFPGLVVN